MPSPESPQKRTTTVSSSSSGFCFATGSTLGCSMTDWLAAISFILLLDPSRAALRLGAFSVLLHRLGNGSQVVHSRGEVVVQVMHQITHGHAAGELTALIHDRQPAISPLVDALYERSNRIGHANGSGIATH